MTDQIREEDEADTPPQETVSFAFDRMTVARFREVFPNARWSDTLQAWTVPGKTARKRIDRLARLRSRPQNALRGRARARRLRVGADPQPLSAGLRPRLPGEDAVLPNGRRRAPSDTLARWNGDDKVWEVPYASYDDLQHRWEAIEEAAKRSEPEERRKRAEARKGTDEEAKAKRRSSERKKRRLPVSSDDLPPIGRPVATSYGIVVITEVTGEIVNPHEIAEHHPDAGDEHLWAGWRAATLEELVHTRPAREIFGEYERLRGWWQPSLDELREARAAAKSRERLRGSREAGGVAQ